MSPDDRPASGHLRRALGGVGASVPLVIATVLMAVLVNAVALGPVDPAGGAPTSPAAASASNVSVGVAGGPEGPRINEDLLGANHVDAGADVAPLRNIAIRSVRVDASLEGSTSNGPAYDCSTGAWSPSLLDPKVAAAKETGAQPLVIVDYTPSCLAKDTPAGDNPNYSPPDIGSDGAKWTALVEQMAEHEIKQEDVTEFEIWNEPNAFFWTGTELQYEQFYGVTARALQAAARAEHTSIEVGGPALAGFSQVPDITWLNSFLGFVAAHRLPLDFLSWHDYFNSPDLGPSGSYPGGICIFGKQQTDGQCDNPQLSPDTLVSAVQQIRQAVAAYPSLHPLLWLDEWNVNAGYDLRMAGTYEAGFVAAVLDEAQAVGLNRATFYEAADDSAQDDFGMLNEADQPKPAYFAFAMWHRLAGYQLPVHVFVGSASTSRKTADSADHVEAIASRTADGEVHVMLDNFDPTGPAGIEGRTMPADLSRRVSVALKGLAAARYQLTRTVVDTTHDGSVLASVDRAVTGGRLQLTAELKAQSVELLTLQPVSAG